MPEEQSVPSNRATIPIVALDFPDSWSALKLVTRLGDSCRFYKVGSELFTVGGPAIVEALRSQGCDVFLDLKLHDIPNTVAGAMRRIGAMDVRLTTVHASGGRAMIEAAVEAAGEGCQVFAVTVLTSLDASALAEVVGATAGNVGEMVVRLAALASSSGARGSCAVVTKRDSFAIVSARRSSFSYQEFGSKGTPPAIRRASSRRKPRSPREQTIWYWAGL